MLQSLLHNKLRTPAILTVSTLFMASCGSYQQASYYDDGIYTPNNRVVSVEKRNAQAERVEQQENNIYGDYFGDKANEYGEILDSEVFTDVDSYSSQTQNDTIPYGEQTDYFAYNNNYNGNPGWGDNPSNISINVYDNSWGWGWNDPWLWNRRLGLERWLGLGLEQPMEMEPLGLGRSWLGLECRLGLERPLVMERRLGLERWLGLGRPWLGLECRLGLGRILEPSVRWKRILRQKLRSHLGQTRVFLSTWNYHRFAHQQKIC
ncbi:hypothetical protein [Flagellimonas sp.]|uniref:hypothetical protein n=1 Tax=Flagellimonas sp. TaxID=2058762 RepID=UPI003BA91763